MKKTVTKKEIAKISKLSEQYMMAIVNSVELLHPMMMKMMKIQNNATILKTSTMRN